MTEVRSIRFPWRRSADQASPSPSIDGLYAVLIEAHGDLDEAESLAFNARLVLLLANHVGDPAVVREAIAVARGSLGRPP